MCKGAEEMIKEEHAPRMLQRGLAGRALYAEVLLPHQDQIATFIGPSPRQALTDASLVGC
jgi:hypothetical protein